MIDLHRVVIYFLISLLMVGLASAVDISSCGNITVSDNYNLTNNISSGGGTCLYIDIGLVSIDCQGYTIDGNIASHLINQNNIHIDNCVINDGYFHITNGGNIIVENTIFTGLPITNSATISYTDESSVRSFIIRNSTIAAASNGYSFIQTNGGRLYINDTTFYGLFSDSAYMGTVVEVTRSTFYDSVHSGPNTGYRIYYNNTFNSTEYFINPPVSILLNTSVGNRWYTPSGDGFSENSSCIDDDFDSICDVAYSPVSGSTDYFPLAIYSGFNACTPIWGCTVYEECIDPLVNASCIDVNDSNSCGDSYAGDFSEFSPVVCDYPPLGSGGGGGWPDEEAVVVTPVDDVSLVADTSFDFDYRYLFVLVVFIVGTVYYFRPRKKLRGRRK